MKLSGLFSRRNFFALGPAFPAAMVSATLTLKEHGKEPIDLDVSVLTWKPGDALVLSTNDLMSMEQMERMSGHVERLFPGVKCIVLDRSFKLEGVLRQDA